MKEMTRAIPPTLIRIQKSFGDTAGEKLTEKKKKLKIRTVLGVTLIDLNLRYSLMQHESFFRYTTVLNSHCCPKM